MTFSANSMKSKNINACMQQCVNDVINKPIYIKELEIEREELQKELISRALYYLPYDNEKKEQTLFLLYAYNHEYEKMFPMITKNRDFLNLVTNKNYSVFGIATITPQNIPFSEQKNFIQKLYMLGRKPTREDKQLALLEKWERVLNKRLLWHCAYKDPSNIIATLPFEIMLFISQNMFDVEESLL
jgi:hypothetical protein